LLYAGQGLERLWRLYSELYVRTQHTGEVMVKGLASRSLFAWWVYSQGYKSMRLSMFARGASSNSGGRVNGLPHTRILLP
jgi:hypothetical protein